MQTKEIVMFGRPEILVCDANCAKAWGINQRPKEQLSDDPDDSCYLADHEVSDAPVPIGSYEGGQTKPLTPQHMNKWCSRECERSSTFVPGEALKAIDFSVRVFNQPWKHLPSNAD